MNHFSQCLFLVDHCRYLGTRTSTQFAWKNYYFCKVDLFICRFIKLYTILQKSKACKSARKEVFKNKVIAQHNDVAFSLWTHHIISFLWNRNTGKNTFGSGTIMLSTLIDLSTSRVQVPLLDILFECHDSPTVRFCPVLIDAVGPSRAQR